jgi:hypothetical protein
MPEHLFGTGGAQGQRQGVNTLGVAGDELTWTD